MPGQHLGEGHLRRLQAGASGVALCAFVITACSTVTPVSAGPVSSRTRAGQLRALTALGIVNELTRAGFSAPKPLDTTAQDCPTIGCDQSIVTDTLRVKSFPTTARAESYAAHRDLYQVERIVVEFAPPVSEPARARYRAEIQKFLE
jgi:hypothetical protein